MRHLFTRKEKKIAKKKYKKAQSHPHAKRRHEEFVGYLLSRRQPNWGGLKLSQL